MTRSTFSKTPMPPALLPVSISLEALSKPCGSRSRITSIKITEPMKAKRDVLPAGDDPPQESLEQYGTYLKMFNSSYHSLHRQFHCLP